MSSTRSAFTLVERAQRKTNKKNGGEYAEILKCVESGIGGHGGRPGIVIGDGAIGAGVDRRNEPAAVVPAPEPAPATGCELLIYSEANFKGMSAPSDQDQSGLGESGWQNEIASVEIKSGTWDFYSDEDYRGEMIRRGAGTYPALDPKWSKHIGSFMCSTLGK